MTTRDASGDAAAESDHNAGGESSSSSSNGKAGWILLGAAALLATGSIGYNVYDGRAADETVAETVEDSAPSIADLREAAEASADDAQPWGELAFAHFQRGEFSDAVSSYQMAVEIDPRSAVLWSALGEARVMALDASVAAADPLPADALEAFQKAVELDPSDPRARYFLAVRKDLDGDHSGAISDWLALLSDTPPGAPWEADVVRTIQQVGAIHDIDVEDRLATVVDNRTPPAMFPGSGDGSGGADTGNLRGPTAQQVAEASRMPPGEQRSMAEGMVARLEGRLQDDPQNIDGWVMLMRSRMTLGEPDRARAALEDAIAANPARAQELRAAAEQVGVR